MIINIDNIELSISSTDRLLWRLTNLSAGENIAGSLPLEDISQLIDQIESAIRQTNFYLGI